MAIRLSLAEWLRTPVQGSVPRAACWFQPNTSGSDFTSQKATYAACSPSLNTVRKARMMVLSNSPARP